MTQFIAIIKASKYRPPHGPVQDLLLTSLEIIYPDGKDCGVPLFVPSYEEAVGILRIAGVSSRELDEKRSSFEKGGEVRIALLADDCVVEAMGFEPRGLRC